MAENTAATMRSAAAVVTDLSAARRAARSFLVIFSFPLDFDRMAGDGAISDQGCRLRERHATGVRDGVAANGDRDALRESWLTQAAGLGFDAPGLAEHAREAGKEAAGEPGRGTAAHREPASGPAETGAAAREDATRGPAAEAVDWAVAHLSEREAVFARTDLLAATLAFDPGGVDIAAVERELAARETAGTLHPARLPGAEGLLTTDRAVADEKETLSLMAAGQGRGAAPMRARTVDKALRNGPLTHGQKAAVEAHPRHRRPHRRRPGLCR